MTALYLPMVLFICHQLVGKATGDALYAKISPIILAALSE